MSKWERRRTALRAAIQMGGGCVPPGSEREDYLTAVAFLLSDEETCKCIALMFKENGPAQRMLEARRGLMLKGLFDGNYWKDGC